MKRLLKITGITIALAAIGVAVRAIIEDKKVYEIKVGGLEDIPLDVQKRFGLGKYSLKE